MNSISINLFVFTIFIGLLSCAVSTPDGFLNINCGATDNANDSNGLQWIPDSPFIKSPSVNDSALASLKSPYLQYQSLTYFRNLAAKKYCYLLPVKRGLHYLVRASFGYNGCHCGIPLARFFDLIIEGIKWTKVDLSDLDEDLYVDYEVILAAETDNLSLCLARNSQPEENRFVYISSIALRPLNSSMYNSTEFEKQALNLIGRTAFGKPENFSGYPNDPFDRLWKPYAASSMSTRSNYLDVVPPENVKKDLGSELLNKPPVNVLRTAIAKQGVGDMTILGAFNLSCSSGSYYFAFYFCNVNERSLTEISNVSINNYRVLDYQQYAFLQCLQVNKILELQTSDSVNIALSGGSTSKMGPFINAAEMYKMLDVQRTYSGDVLAIRKIAEAINVPHDWIGGDPCFPADYSATGITCNTDNPARVIIINLRNKGLEGTLPPEIANLTALTQLLLGNNNLSGPIPDFSSLKNLTKPQLQNNQLTGEMPCSLENLPNLTQVCLHSNNLNGRVPQCLPGRDICKGRQHKIWKPMLAVGLSAIVGGAAIYAALQSKLIKPQLQQFFPTNDNMDEPTGTENMDESTETENTDDPTETENKDEEEQKKRKIPRKKTPPAPRKSRPADQKERQVPRSEVTMPPPTNASAYQAISSQYADLENKHLEATLEITRLEERSAMMSQSRGRSHSMAAMPSTFVSPESVQGDRPENSKE